MNPEKFSEIFKNDPHAAVNGSTMYWLGANIYKDKDNNLLVGEQQDKSGLTKITFDTKAFAAGDAVTILDPNGIAIELEAQYGLVRFPESGRGFARYSTQANNDSYKHPGTGAGSGEPWAPSRGDGTCGRRRECGACPSRGTSERWRHRHGLRRGPMKRSASAEWSGGLKDGKGT